jgi:lipoate-protein ligase A
MAIDEAIMDAVAEGTSPATLRFYAWSPPCLSLGRSQPLSDADLVACRAASVDVVRRPTGGRAILHTDELTYSVALLQSDPRATGDVVASYRRLSLGLLAGLRELGAEAVQAVREQAPNADLTAVCFETPSNYEIVAGGRKLVGSAQWRARGGVLQHGSLPLHGDLARIVDYLEFSSPEPEVQRHRVHARATTLEETIGRVLPPSSVAQSLAHGFSQALNVTLVRGELTPNERTLAAELRFSRYAASDWTARVPE